MSDDVKKALERLRQTAECSFSRTDVARSDLRILLTHIDGEPARAKRVFAEGMAAGRARLLVDLKALLEVK